MLNPMTGILLEGKYFGYVTDSFRENLPLRNSVIESQGVTRNSNALGKSKETFTISLSIDNTYNVYAGSSYVGSTTWLGISRLTDLKTFVGAQGVSMPLTFVTPYGATYTVIPTGAIDINIYNPERPGEGDSTEFRVSLTLEAL